MPPCDVDPTRDETAGPGSSSEGGSHSSVTLSFSVPARLAAPWLSRTRVRAWLESLDFTDDFVSDLEYAVSEAVSNSAEHAYPPDVEDGSIDVTAELITHRTGARQVRVRVRDSGRWQPIDPTPRDRGHGLVAMAALTHTLTIRRGDGDTTGTEVDMLSPLVGSDPTAPDAAADRNHPHSPESD